MRDIMGMMGKVKEMQAKMEQMQADIAALEVEGKSGGGLVSVRMTGKGEMLGLKIDPSLFKEEEVEILEDLVIAAHKDAKDKAEALAAEKTRGSADPARHEAAVLRISQPDSAARSLSLIGRASRRARSSSLTCFTTSASRSGMVIDWPSTGMWVTASPARIVPLRRTLA